MSLLSLLFRLLFYIFVELLGRMILSLSCLLFLQPSSCRKKTLGILHIVLCLLSLISLLEFPLEFIRKIEGQSSTITKN